VVKRTWAIQAKTNPDIGRAKFSGVLSTNPEHFLGEFCRVGLQKEHAILQQKKVLLNPLTFASVRFGPSSITQNFDMLLAPIAVLMVVFDATSTKG
jgi:hypothetical protein